MGNYCATNPKFKEPFQLIREYENRAYGLVKVVRNDKLGKDIAIKQHIFSSKADFQEYLKALELAKQYENIPTLVKVNSFSVDQEFTQTQLLQKGNQATPYSGPFNNNNNNPGSKVYTVTIQFDCMNQNFGQLLFQRKVLLNEFIKKNKKTMDLAAINKIALYEYEKIDSETHINRKYLSLFFLEGQILRMIDHVVGAIYFLNHFQNNHCSVRPDNILIDGEGKYIVIDPKVMRCKTNTQLIVSDKQMHPYLSPQQFNVIKNNRTCNPANIEVIISRNVNPQKADIFTVGLLALEMATLQSITGIYDFNEWKINFVEINRLVAKCKSRYSPEFSEMLQTMLDQDDKTRVNYSTLIDVLSPILTKNLEQMQRVYSGGLSYRHQTAEDEIYARLAELQQNYQRLANSNEIWSLLSRETDDENVEEINQRLEREQQELFQRMNGGGNPHKRDGSNARGPQKEQVCGEIGSSQLYNLYLKEYHTIKRSRQRF